MARKLDDVMATLPKDRKKRVEDRAMELATLKDLRLAVQQTQEQMAAALGVRQDTISRLENAAICCFQRCGTTWKAWAESWNWWLSFLIVLQW